MCFKPLTMLRPLYLGGIHPVESNTMAATLIYPTIYTATGAAITLLSLLTGENYNEFIGAINDDGFKVYGVYAVEDLRNETILLPYSAAAPPGSGPKPKVESWASGIRLHPVLEPAKRRPGITYFARLRRVKKGWKIIEIITRKYVTEQRIGIAIEHEKKRAAGDRALYTYTAFHGLDRGRSLETLFYCIEVADSRGLLKDLKRGLPIHGVTGFGGRSSAAEYFLFHIKEEPYFAVSVEEEGEYRLAASHVAVKVDGEGLVTVRGEVAELACGSVGMLSGWDYAENVQKRPIAAMAPGSLYHVESSGEWDPPDKWYYRLLRSSVPLR